MLHINKMILLIQIGYLTPSIKTYLDEEYEIIKAYYYDILGDILNDINLDNYDKVIILGGHQSIKDIKEYRSLRQIVKLIEKCYETNKKVLGICLGAQLIAYSRGCKIGRLNEPKNGYDADIEIDGIIYKNLFRSHYDYIIPNDDIEVLCSSENIPYLIRSGSLIGIQCHPDIPPEDIHKYTDLDRLTKQLLISNEEMNERNKKILMQLLKN